VTFYYFNKRNMEKAFGQEETKRVEEDLARVGARVEKPLRDAAREDGVSDAEKDVLDSVADRRSDEAMKGLLSEESIAKRFDERMTKLEAIKEQLAEKFEGTKFVYTGLPFILDRGNLRTLEVAARETRKSARDITKEPEPLKMMVQIVNKMDEIRDQAEKSRTQLKEKGQLPLADQIDAV
jgi:hypothetical protein